MCLILIVLQVSIVLLTDGAGQRPLHEWYDKVQKICENLALRAVYVQAHFIGFDEPDGTAARARSRHVHLIGAVSSADELDLDATGSPSVAVNSFCSTGHPSLVTCDLRAHAHTNTGGHWRT